MSLSVEEQHQLAWLLRFDALEHPTRPSEEDNAELDLPTCPHCNARVSSVSSIKTRGYKTGVLPFTDKSLICGNCQLCVIESREIMTDYASVAPRSFANGEGTGHDPRGASSCYGYDELLRTNPMLRDPKDKNQRYYHYQPYRRLYHFNERIKMRNNVEPRIPLQALLLIRRLVLSRLPDYVLPDDITAELVQAACRAIHGLYPYAERWLQIRYFILTGRRTNEPGSTMLYDIPLLSDRQTDQLGWYFQRVSRAFDEIFYLSSKNTTIKDNVWGRPPEETKLARHNLMQYNYVLHQGILACFGVEEYIRLRTEFCFPLHKTDAALKKLNVMHEAICSKIGSDCHQLPLTSQSLSYEELENELNSVLRASA